ncbi:putative drug transporter [Fasciola hepatica]|uniref:Drug transporter n=1 Tax=Fasciola hepatica TaxID=6192 RepID=A0A2H1C1T4_FASHE|nr:putative drug transporter [Fasciola hepatica]
MAEPEVTPKAQYKSPDFETDKPQSCHKTLFSPKCLQVFVSSSWGFLTNVERAIIMPSLWLYLQTAWSATAAKQFYAATLAAFCLAILLVTPLIGYAAHKGVRTHVLLLCSNQLEILGNVMYLVGHSPWVVLAGRFISGIGACCDPPLYADMVKLTTTEERTSYVIAMLLPRQVGLLFGPAFTILVHKLNVSVGDFNLNVYNVPGLLMATLWGLHCFLVLACYPNVDKAVHATEPSTPGPVSFSGRVRRYFFDPPRQKHQADTNPILDDDGSVDQPLKHRPPSSCSTCPCSSYCNSLRPYLSLPLITMYSLCFMVNFTTMCLEAVLPPATDRLFGWTEVEVSWVYLAAGGVVFVVFLCIRCLTICMYDRTILTCGLISLLFGYLWFACTYAYRPTPDKVTGIAMSMCGLLLHVIGVPMVATSSESLYSKLAPKEDMDRAQTIYRTVVNVGFFAGPYLGGSLNQVPHAAFILMLLLVFIPLVCLCTVYEKFVISNDSCEQDEVI